MLKRFYKWVLALFNVKPTVTPKATSEAALQLEPGAFITVPARGSMGKSEHLPSRNPPAPVSRELRPKPSAPAPQVILTSTPSGNGPSLALLSTLAASAYVASTHDEDRYIRPSCPEPTPSSWGSSSSSSSDSWGSSCSSSSSDSGSW